MTGENKQNIQVRYWKIYINVHSVSDCDTSL